MVRADGVLSPAESAALSTLAREVGSMRFWRCMTEAQQAGHVVVESQGHHHQHDGHPAALQPFQPPLGDRPSRHCLEKIIHQVPPIEDRQRKQVQHPEADADDREQPEVIREAEADRLTCDIGDRQRPAEVLQRGLADQHLAEHLQRQRRRNQRDQ